MILQAFAAGLLAAAALLLGSIIAVLRPVKTRTVGLIMAFGSGALISSVAYELVEEAFSMSSGNLWVGVAFFLGAFTFYVGDILIERVGGAKRKSARGEQSGAALGIVLGSILDGIPESFVLGISLVGGGTLSLAYFSGAVSYTHLRAHETPEHLVCRLLLEKKKHRTYIKPYYTLIPS